MSNDQTPLLGKLVGISISDSLDLARLGYGEQHLYEAMITIARQLLRQGADLAYGGDLRPYGFTRTLFNLVRSEHDQKRGPWTKRLTNFLAWPYYLSLTKDEQARLMSTCRFVRITPDIACLGDLRDSTGRSSDAETAYHKARCLSVMRVLMNKGYQDPISGEPIPPLSARIVLGGKKGSKQGGEKDRFYGIMPGIVEEAMFTLEQKKPLYIIGGFGGAAGALAEALIREEYPPELTLVYHQQHSFAYQPLLDVYAKHTEVEQPAAMYQRLRQVIDMVRAEGLAKGLHNGLTEEENKALMSSERLEEISHLIRKGMMEIWGDSPHPKT